MDSADGHLDGAGDTRSALGIAWSCLAIIFACTWTAIHPNIPSEHIRHSEWKLRRWRLIQAIWALMVPELMVMWAVQQWAEARRVSEAYNTASGIGKGGMAALNDIEKNDGTARPWTSVHSFFLVMGGIINRAEDGTTQIVHYRDVVPQIPPQSSEDRQSLPDDAAQPPPFELPTIDKEEIDDKSKGDALAKAIVVIQTSYFLIQLLARVARRLTITKLEIMTLAYALLCGMLYAFWWHKPYNVQRPISIRIQNFKPQPPPQKPAGGGYLARIMNGGFVLNLHGSIVGDGEGLEVLGELNGELELSMNVNLHRVATISSFMTATAFGGVHCIAWNFEFITRPERLIWNICSALVTAIPLVWIVMVLLGYFVDQLRNKCANALFKRFIHVALGIPLFVLVFILVCAYFLCRVILVVEAFVLLRDLPPSAAASVDWTSFIPHV
ncbi:hypothetical protein AB1N83_008264 [Pleurotus pulmonarius]